MAYLAQYSTWCRDPGIMAEIIKKKIKTRGGHKSVVRQAITKAKNLLPADGAAVAHGLKPKLEAIKGTLTRGLDEIKKLTKEIIEIADDEELMNKELLETAEFAEEIDEVIFLINSFCAIQSYPTVVNTAPNLNIVEKVKLPKLSLVTFDGEPTNWQPFWDSFGSSIHKNTALANVDKLQYLKQSLIGIAADTISGLPLTNSSYGEAVDLLEKRFGVKQVVISRHMEILMELPKIVSNTELRKLRHFYDKAEATVRSLKSLGVDTNGYSTFITPVIMAKIPQELRLIVSRKMTEEWSLEALLKELGEELSLREKCALAPVDGKVPPTEGKGKFYRPMPCQPTVATLMVNGDRRNRSQNQDRRNIPNCLFCDRRHYSASCTAVTDPRTRKNILRERNRCFICLKDGHFGRNCNSNIKCYHCGDRHHSSICNSISFRRRAYEVTHSPRETHSNNAAPQRSESNGNDVSTNLFISQDPTKNSVLLQTAQAIVHRVDNDITTPRIRLILDSGSQKTYITRALRDKLQLPTIRTDKVLIKEFGNDKGTLKKCDLVQLAVRGEDNLTIYIFAYVVDVICSPLSNQVIQFAQNTYPHLRNLRLADQNPDVLDIEIHLLIGADYFWSFMLDSVIRGETGIGPVATLSRFGYVLSGPVPVHSSREFSSNITISHVLKMESTIADETEAELNCQLHRFWDYETLGIKEQQAEILEQDSLMKDKIDSVENRYEVSLPFKESHPILPDNFQVSQNRLISQLARLRKNPAILEQYDEVIREQIESGVVVVVEDDYDQPVALGKVHYIPHRGVIRQTSETTKLRIVYDASCKVNSEVSLNDCLEPGPNLSPLLFDILLRFRLQKVALIADIEKAFLNISINPTQRDLLRFLWVKDSNAENLDIIIMRFTRLVFGLTCSPYILNATIRHHLESTVDSDRTFVDNVVSSMYVDDFASSFPTENEGLEMYKKLKKHFLSGGFNFRKFATNKADLLDKIEKEEQTYTPNQEVFENENVLSFENANQVSNHVIRDSKNLKVLGIPWDKDKDKFLISFASFNEVATKEMITKRVVISTIARFYDPHGLLAPVIVPLKQSFQEICKIKISWDDKLPVEIASRFQEILRDIVKVREIELDRCLINEANVESLEIHGFADASVIAFGACVYLRMVTGNRVVVRLIASKTRIAPLKTQTIPRLELMATLLLARLVTSVNKALMKTIQIDRVFCWSDSQIALWWIKNDSTVHKPFVQNRATEIRNLIAKENWEYCPTTVNPADLASRGCRCTRIVNNQLWWTGPSFLKEPPDNWPKFCDPPRDQIALAIQEKIMDQSILTVSIENRNLNLSALISCEKYSDYNKLLRVTAVVLRFTKLVQGKLPNDNKGSIIDSDDIKEAKTLWHREIQKSFDTDKTFAETKRHLRIVKDGQGVYRVSGRLENAPLPFTAKYPVLLPRRNYFTELVVRKYHQAGKHNGTNETLNQIRMEYWICKGRQTVKTLLSKCSRCKRFMGKSFDTPDAPPLPEFRVSDDVAFSNIAVDFAGPLYVKDIYSQSKETYKCYIALFTCASTRAIHLELCVD